MVKSNSKLMIIGGLLAAMVVASWVSLDSYERFAAAASDSWRQSGLAGMRVTVLKAIPGQPTLYAATLMQGVFSSHDNGNTWEAYGSGLPNAQLFAMAACASDSLFAGSWGQGVFRSFTATKVWTSASQGITDPYISALACSAEYVFAGTNASGVFRSVNNGENWRPVNGGLSNLAVLSLAVIGDSLYAGTNSGVFASDDDGDSWQLIGLQGQRVYGFVLSPAGELWAGASSGVFRFSNQAWTLVGDMELVVYTLTKDSQGAIYAGTRDNRVYRWESNSWLDYDTGMVPERVYWLTVSGNAPEYLLAGTTDGVWIREIILPTPTFTPTPTNTPTPTHTPTPTATPTATPDLSLALSSVPYPGPVFSGDTVTYLIDVDVMGARLLEQVTISNTIPVSTTLIPDSISPPGRLDDGNVILWEWPRLRPASRIILEYTVSVDSPSGESLSMSTRQGVSMIIYNVGVEASWIVDGVPGHAIAPGLTLSYVQYLPLLAKQ